MLKQNVIEIGAARKTAAVSQFSQPDLIRELPDLPVLPETLVKLELASRDRPVELARVSEMILFDLGAAIELMRLASRDWEDGGHPERIEDSISHLGIPTCLDAVSKHIMIRCKHNLPIVEAWEHAGVIAYLSGLLVLEMDLYTTPEDARWVGLCHEIGRLPEILGWDMAGKGSFDVNLAGLSMAKAWSLPRCVVQYFSERRDAKSNSRLTAIVDEAHRMIKRESAPRQEGGDSSSNYSFLERVLTI